MLTGIEHDLANACCGLYGIKICAFDRWFWRLGLQARKAVLKNNDVVLWLWYFRREAAWSCRAEWAKAWWRQESAILPVRCGRKPFTKQWIVAKF
jgi:hypothetical protein